VPGAARARSRACAGTGASTPAFQEEPEIENTAAIASELGAAQILQQNNPGLFISITMPSIAERHS
jgi:hypothetical protein